MNDTNLPTPPTTLQLVQFACGCVGSTPDEDGISFLLSTCDSDDESPGSKTGRVMTPMYVPVLDDYIHILMRNAQAYHDLQQIKSALRLLKEST